MAEMIAFTAQYEWLFNFKVTNFFTDRIWEKAPTEWLTLFETLSSEDIENLPFGRIKESYPGSLKEFIQGALKYSLPREINSFKSSFMKSDSGAFIPVHEHDIPCHIRKGMTEKKLHEVCRLTSLINAVLKESHTEYVVDVGSGLGYLGQVLNALFHHRVLGLEGKQSHASGAEKRTVKNHTESPYLQNRICELYPSVESETNFKIVLSDWLSNFTPDGKYSCSNNFGSQFSCSKSVKEYGNHLGIKSDSVNGLSYVDFQVSHLKNERTCSKEYQDKHVDMQNMTGYSIETSRNCMKQNLDSQRKNDERERLALCTRSQFNICVDSGDSGHTLTRDEEKYVSMSATGQINSKSQENMVYGAKASDFNTHISSEGVPVLTLETPITHRTPICMVGLHCCGDLTPTMLKYFTKMEFIKAVCIVSCCYHRMEYSDKDDRFTNFPLSQCVNQSLAQLRCRYPWFRYTPYSMRLAAQETRARWKFQTSEDHDYHVKNVAYRGILELALKEGLFKLKKASRKLVNRSDYCSFVRYITAVYKHIDVPNGVTSDQHLQSFQHTMNQLYSEYEKYFVYIEPITALQFLLQPVLESLIYIDRLTWLREQEFDGEIIPVFDEFMSPRNLALIAIKR